MDKDQLIERERRNGRLAGILGLVGLFLFIGAGALGLGGEFNSLGSEAESFECRFDDEEFASCSEEEAHAPAEPLDRGRHTFEARAIDAEGEPDPSPASRTFIVVEETPEITITAGPMDTVADGDATFAFAGADGEGFRCSIDGGPSRPCDSPQGYEGLEDGEHSFRVLAIDGDREGSGGPSAERTWTVDSAVAEEEVRTRIDSGPAGPTTEVTPTFELTGGNELYDRLPLFEAEKGEIYMRLGIQSAGLVLFIAPLMFLFQAAAARNPRVRTGLIGLTVAGPLFYAGSLVASGFAFDAASSALADAAGPADGESLSGFAEDVVADQSAADIASGLQFAGLLGVVIIIIYTSLQAMRVGLMTRFIGTLGMAFGAGILFLGLPALLAFFLMISLLVANWWFGGRPPAWETGTAMPWPKPGEQTDEPPPPGEEPAQAEDFDRYGKAVEPEQRPGRRENRRKRKRKQRRD